MGLFTNRKRNADHNDLVDPARAIAIPLGGDETEHDADDVTVDEVDVAVDEVAANDIRAEAPTESALPPFADALSAIEPSIIEPSIIEPSGIDVIETEPTPIVDAAPTPIIETEARPINDIEADVPPMPKRRLADRPKAQAGNVEIDAEGLLALLGLDPDAPLIEVSDAHLRFVADHEPTAGDDDETVEVKRRILREVKSAYASFRLTRLG